MQFVAFKLDSITGVKLLFYTLLRSETESSLYCESAKEVLSKKKVTETVTSKTAKIKNEKEIAIIKISEHILITLCQLRNIAGSRE